MAKKKTAKKAAAAKTVKRPAAKKAAKAGPKKAASKKTTSGRSATKQTKKKVVKKAAVKKASTAKSKAAAKKTKVGSKPPKKTSAKAGTKLVAKPAATTKKSSKTRKAAAGKRSGSTAKTSKSSKAAVPDTPKKRTGKPRFTQKTTLVQGRRGSAKLVPPVLPYRPAAETESENHEPLTVAQLRKVKTGLTKRDLDHFYRQLLDRRAVIAGDVDTMQLDARNGDGTLSHVPVHMADIGSDNYEQEFTLGLVESERKLLMEIDAAIERIRDRIYGVCIERGIPIGRARLDAKPWAKYCIEEARERERRLNR